MNVKPIFYKTLASILLVSALLPAWGMDKATVRILPHDDVIYKISSDIGFENWNFGIDIKGIKVDIDRLEVSHYSAGEQLNHVEYAKSTLSAYLRTMDDGGITSTGFHMMLPKKLNADRLVVEFFSNDKSLMKKSIKLERFEQKNTYRFPLQGTWFISSGYDFGVEHRRHLSRGHFSYDILKVNELGQYSKGTELKDNFSFGLPVFSPAAGTVIKVHDGEKDGKPGTRPGKANYIEIDHGEGEVSRFVHLKMGSILVAAGDKVASGQEIAAIGKSGTKDVHLHFGFQRNIVDAQGHKKQIPIPALFSDYFVSWNQGSNKLVELGRPRRGQFIRHN
ncbi:M23 family metallopeptidase [Thalassomonas haliotis]|uniref:M23 family metallopeptidase n=1 Tax=Thalassomonas haliotis TaxID=485448 RepID=A0ABY7V6L5_9GAMM|nr:M23 family metallopeptidase [Thalassomonas haliotis]WDE09359.1 M23 family metallopeptidase [Thalassomonas haliotis]